MQCGRRKLLGYVLEIQSLGTGSQTWSSPLWLELRGELWNNLTAVLLQKNSFKSPQRLEMVNQRIKQAGHEGCSIFLSVFSRTVLVCTDICYGSWPIATFPIYNVWVTLSNHILTDLNCKYYFTCKCITIIILYSQQTTVFFINFNKFIKCINVLSIRHT